MGSIQWGAYVRPFPGEAVSGDAVAERALDGGMLFAVIDALGHGASAHGVAVLVSEYIRGLERVESMEDIFAALHEVLRDSVGAALGLLFVEEATGTLEVRGLGNVRFRLYNDGEEPVSFVSTDGIVGTRSRPPMSQRSRITPGGVLFAYTDGVEQRFDWRELFWQSMPPASIARGIVQRFGKAHDDAGCLVVRYV